MTILAELRAQINANLAKYKEIPSKIRKNNIAVLAQCATDDMNLVGGTPKGM